MTNLKSYRSKGMLFSLILFFSLSCIFSNTLMGNDQGGSKEKQGNEVGQLKTYQQKSLFIFPLLCNNSISSGVLNDQRKQFMAHQLYKMFVTDFKRINFYDVKSDDTIDNFLQDAQSYIRKNVKHITALRMNDDGKFKEAMVTGADLFKTMGNSFALVPYIDSVESKVVKDDDSTRYRYNMYIHFDIYNTMTKERLKTLKINNKKNILGSLASVTGSMQVDNSDLEGMSERRKQDEESFRNATAGLYTILKKELRRMPQFSIMATLSQVSASKFGFDMGKDTGIKIDHRYRTYVSKADGSKKMTGFGKIRKVKTGYSEAQTLIGKPQEGDQVMEDPKVGINLVAGYATAPLQISMGNGDIVSGLQPCALVGIEYGVGSLLKVSELYTALHLRVGAPKADETFTLGYDSGTQIIVDFGLLKKFYLRRFSLNIGGYVGYHSADVTIAEEEITGAGFGFTLNAGLEIMLSPSFGLYGAANYDMYPNPSKLKDQDDDEYDFPTGWEWNAKGLSFNLGAKVTF
jgi:hypothetical protein